MKYRPANGAEGMRFMARYCDRCERDRDYRERDRGSCPIAAATMAFKVDEPDYPKEWQFDPVRGARCTAYLPEDATDTRVDDPRQLTLPVMGAPGLMR